MADIFISYSGEDKSRVEQLATLLGSKGWTVWWDRQIPIGERYDDVIEKELRSATCVVVMWTQHSVNSEWVKNEASDAAQRGVLVPVVLEPLKIPIAFRRIEAAILTGWKDDPDDPELGLLFNSIATTIEKKRDAGDTGNPHNNEESLTGSKTPYQERLRFRKRLKVAAYVLVLLGCIITVLLLSSRLLEPSERNVTIRVFDSKRNPVTQGEVKIYLNEYIRTQSLDKVGQALFNGIPAGSVKQNMKVEVSSPGYTTRTFDTLLPNAKPLELTLPLSTVVFIRGTVKTAAEVPIKGVEINVDGTRYYAISISDGSYNLRVEEYTLGDEITLTTSHAEYEDKTISLRINSPEITKQDIFLNPITH